MSAPSPQDVAPVGMPRPRAPWRTDSNARCPQLPDRLPVPWINDPADFGSFTSGCEIAYEQRLCGICGCLMGATIVFGASTPTTGDDEGPWTSGAGGHPKCMLLAATTCPALVEREHVVAWQYTGDGHGYRRDLDPEYVCEEWGAGEPLDLTCQPLDLDQLKALAKSDSWGGAAAPTACPIVR